MPKQTHAELDGVGANLYAGRVPVGWSTSSSAALKSLAGWRQEITARVEQLTLWATGGYPRAYWLGGLWNPASFLAAVLQTAARRLHVSVDSLVFDHLPVESCERDLPTTPDDGGVYVKGLFLEGAGWDREASCLKEPDPMDLLVPMPIVHFRPTGAKRRGDTRDDARFYASPMYVDPARSSSGGGDGFLGFVELKSGTDEAPVEPGHWVVRGTALLLSQNT